MGGIVPYLLFEKGAHGRYHIRNERDFHDLSTSSRIKLSGEGYVKASFFLSLTLSLSFVVFGWAGVWYACLGKFSFFNFWGGGGT